MVNFKDIPEGGIPAIAYVDSTDYNTPYIRPRQYDRQSYITSLEQYIDRLENTYLKQQYPDNSMTIFYIIIAFTIGTITGRFLNRWVNK